MSSYCYVIAIVNTSGRKRDYRRAINNRLNIIVGIILFACVK